MPPLGLSHLQTTLICTLTIGYVTGESLYLKAEGLPSPLMTFGWRNMEAVYMTT